jgi:hypothetical protein
MPIPIISKPIPCRLLAVLHPCRHALPPTRAQGTTPDGAISSGLGVPLAAEEM